MDDIVIISSLEEGVDFELYLEAFGEQLEASDLTTRIVHETSIHRSLLCNGRGFVLHNVEYSDRVRRFIEEGKRMNKTFFLLNYAHQNWPEDQMSQLVENVIDVGGSPEEKGNHFFINPKLSEKVVGLLNRELPYKQRNSIYLDVSDESFERIAGAVERFLNVNKGRRLYTVREVNKDLFSQNAQEKIRYVDLNSIRSIVKAVNHSKAAFLEDRDDELYRSIKSLQEINRTPLIQVDPNSNDSNIDRDILKGRKKLESPLFKKSFEILHRDGSMYNTSGLREYIIGTLKPSVGINIPGGKVGGGVLVAIKHGEVLQRNGYDVTMLSDQNYDHQRFYEIESRIIPGVSRYTENITAYFDKIVATLWNTQNFVSTYKKATDRYYLIQGYETDFSNPGMEERILANKTYFDSNIQLVTVSPWCMNWLKDDYGRTDVKLVLNGIDLQKFPFTKREREGKFKILIEGNPNEPFRGVDEAFTIVNTLDRSKFEIHFLSTREVIRDWYKPDKKFFSVPHDEVHEVFTECDLLLKCSVLESFSYPPLEMMATGGVCVVANNDGNAVYSRDGENCYTYDSGDVDKARERILELADNRDLYDSFVNEGVETVKEFSWKKLESKILDAYSV